MKKARRWGAGKYHHKKYGTICLGGVSRRAEGTSVKVMNSCSSVSSKTRMEATFPIL